MAGPLGKTAGCIAFVVTVAILASLLTACTAASDSKSNGQLASPMAAVRAAHAIQPAFPANASGAADMPEEAVVQANAEKVTVDLTARNISFDKQVISVPAGVQVTVKFNNTDLNTYHNFSVYTDEGAAIPIFKGQIILGPSTVQYVFTAPSAPGNYFFRSDVHPALMTGILEVK